MPRRALSVLAALRCAANAFNIIPASVVSRQVSNGKVSRGRRLSNRVDVHPRNAFQGNYDMELLVASHPELGRQIIPAELSRGGKPTIKFSDPTAILELNRALLLGHYGVKWWEFPAGNLCPPVPGRADYVHYLADVLAESSRGQVPTGRKVRFLEATPYFSVKVLKHPVSSN